MRLLISFAALFASVLLMQLGAGGVAPIDAVSGLQLHFTKAEVGVLGSAHFLGFFVGCWWAPRLMGTIGHSRAYAACAAAGTIGMLAHMMWVNPVAWAGFRVLSGLSVAGCYTVIEAWLHGKVTNETRGRATGVYRVVDISGSLLAQLLVSVLPPAEYMSYNLLAIFCCAALLPLTLTRVGQPETPAAPRLRPGLAFQCSPLGSVAVIVSGVSGAAFRMVGPIYGIAVGLSTSDIALFLAAYVAGGGLAQIPMGALADKFDRRMILIWLSAGAILASIATIALAGMGPLGASLGAGLFGFFTIPIYSVASAHGHDYARPDQRVELSAAQMFLYAVGAIASPVFVSTLIAVAGPKSMFVFISLAHILLIVFGLARMRARPSVSRTSYVYVPRTSFLIGRLLGKARDRAPGE
ncbi:MFS transporter [Acidimangrovimonas sediminis]|uniref:MFS transporter n=1 Tax=Acidimangrovimonas sediminis TaxID=2056283 RepID=UPI000C80B879|nr:MFS transporter [Acidimangrovimonas sediminis]